MREWLLNLIGWGKMDYGTCGKCPARINQWSAPVERVFLGCTNPGGRCTVTPNFEIMPTAQTEPQK